jgi:hypothetical protein
VHAPRWLTVLVAVAAGAALSGCSSTPGVTTSSTTAAAVAAAAATTAASEASSTPPAPTSSDPSSTPPTASAVAVTSNPCDVLTQAEATALSGASMPAGVRQPWGSGGAVKCGYHSGSTEAFLILAKASSPATAQAAWDAEKADLQKQAAPAGVKVTATAVTGIGDQAELFVGSVSVNGIKNTVMAIFVLKGDTFLDLGDFALLGAKPATTADLTSQAATSAGRV